MKKRKRNMTIRGSGAGSYLINHSAGILLKDLTMTRLSTRFRRIQKFICRRLCSAKSVPGKIRSVRIDARRFDLLALRAARWLRVLIALPVALAIMTLAFHSTSNALPSAAKIENCQKLFDGRVIAHSHKSVHTSPCCADICPSVFAAHIGDMSVIEPRVALTLAPAQHDDRDSFDPAGPHRPPR